MSGFLAVVSSTLPTSDLTSRFQSAFDTLKSRGPDSQKSVIAGPAALGHALLVTDEPTAPRPQPFSLNGTAWIVADARLDDRAKLIASLEMVQRQDSLDDAELLFLAYQKWGETCVEHLIGDFSFAICDSASASLFCARDQIGVKPLFYAEYESGIAVSNTLQAILALSGFPQTINDASVGDFLLFGLVQDLESTFFEKIRRVPPAHIFSWRNGQCCMKRYWQIPQAGPLYFKNEEDCVEEFRSRLNLAAGDRVRNGRAAILFSGGMDSTSVAATAKEALCNTGKEPHLKAFTSVYESLFQDTERHYASVAAAFLQIPIEFTCGDDFPLLAGSTSPPILPPAPSEDPFPAFGADLHRSAASYSRIGLVGEGGDVAFHPQTGPYLAMLMRQFHWFGAARKTLDCLLVHKRLPPLLMGFRSKFSFSFLQDAELPFPEWIDPAFSARESLEERWREHANRPSSSHPFRPAACDVLGGNVWPDFFESNDPGATGINFELRAPLFDLRVLTWLLALPPLPWFIDKWLPRRAMVGRLPEEIRIRPKTPLPVLPAILLAHSSSARWLDGLQLEEETQQFVTRGRIFPITTEEHPVRLLMKLRAVCLNYWLQNLKGVQYKND